MTIAEATRLAILELKSQGRSIRDIVAETGASKSTVERVIKKGGAVPKTALPARACASNALSSKNEDRNEDAPSHHVSVIEVRTITRDMTISEFYNLLQSAKDDLAIARRNNDGSKDAVMAVSAATKTVTEILKQMGKWCGLDDTLTGESKKPTVGRADVEAMTLSEMAELVRTL